jgi:hypothetical protein
MLFAESPAPKLCTDRATIRTGPNTDSLASQHALFHNWHWIAPNILNKLYRVLAQREMRLLLARWLETANGEMPKCSAASSIRSWV